VTGELAVWFASGVVLSCVVASLFAYPLGNRRTVGALVASAGVWAFLVAAAYVAGEVRTLSAAVLFVVAGTAASLPAAGIFGALGRANVPTAAAAALWTLVALVPPAVLLFGNGSMWILETVGVLDYAGALIFAVPAVGIVVVLRLARSRATGDPSPPARHPLVAAVLIWISVLAWLVGSELTLSEATPGILLAGVVAPVVSAIGWAVVERIRFATNTVAAAGSGAIAGLVAVLAAAPYVDLLWSCVLGAVVGPVTAMLGFAHSGPNGWRGSPRHLIAILPVAGAVGIVFLGLFANERGLVYTGKLDSLLTQLSAVVLVAVWSAACGVLVSMLLRTRRTGRHRGAHSG
jgi:Amt family ammonium transporter